MFLVPINYVAILLCAIVAMAIGFIWYGPLFGKEWIKLIGMKGGKMLRANENMAKTYGIMFLSSLLMAYSLAHFTWYAAPGSLTIFIAVKTAVWGWLGFVATTTLTRFLFSPDEKPMKLFAIDTGYYLATLVAMAVIIALMPA